MTGPGPIVAAPVATDPDDADLDATGLDNAGLDNAGPGMSVLEARYRRLLRVLPAGYRRAWEDEMVATFLDSMRVDDPEQAAYVDDFGRPPRGEVASVLALAVRLRLGGAGSARSVPLGDAVRRLALVVLLVNTVLGLVSALVRLWTAGEVPLLPPPGSEWMMPMPDGVLGTAFELSGLLWLPAYVALVLGFRRPAMALAPLAFLPGAAAAVMGIVETVTSWGASSAANQVLVLLFDASLLLALAAFHAGAPPVRPRPWLLALPASAAGAALLLVLAWQIPANYYALDWPGLWCVVVVAAALWYVAGRALGRLGDDPAWPLAVTLLAAAVLGLRGLTLLPYAGNDFPDRAPLLVAGLVHAAVLLAIGVPMGLRAARAMRGLARTEQPIGG
jgi:hypothetical protein